MHRDRSRSRSRSKFQECEFEAELNQMIDVLHPVDDDDIDPHEASEPTKEELEAELGKPPDDDADAQSHEASEPMPQELPEDMHPDDIVAVAPSSDAVPDAP
jgi:hypothetical protein